MNPTPEVFANEMLPDASQFKHTISVSGVKCYVYFLILSYTPIYENVVSKSM